MKLLKKDFKNYIFVFICYVLIFKFLYYRINEVKKHTSLISNNKNNLNKPKIIKK